MRTCNANAMSSRQYLNIENPFNKLFRDSDSTWAMVARLEIPLSLASSLARFFSVCQCLLVRAPEA